jgi:magnesium chelatase family protein
MITYEELERKEGGESSTSIRKRVESARNIQAKRYQGRKIYFNSSMRKTEIEEFCKLKRCDRDFLKQIYETQNLSARGYEKLLKISRTIADLDGSKEIEKIHLAEAAGLRGLEGKYWGGIYGQP